MTIPDALQGCLPRAFALHASVDYSRCGGQSYLEDTSVYAHSARGSTCVCFYNVSCVFFTVGRGGGGGKGSRGIANPPPGQGLTFPPWVDDFLCYSSVDLHLCALSLRPKQYNTDLAPKK